MSSLPRRSTASSSGGLSAPLSLYDVHNLSYVKNGSNIITIYKNKFRKLKDTGDTEDTGDMGDTGGTVETAEMGLTWQFWDMISSRSKNGSYQYQDDWETTEQADWAESFSEVKKCQVDT